MKKPVFLEDDWLFYRLLSDFCSGTANFAAKNHPGDAMAKSRLKMEQNPVKC
ncbi:hypothetical protein [Anaerobiospirillum sp. NML120449]|uniref:hypothetical protein n=1 Tax=Anaerobiospirillum sp. NML120449 TaxID=2932817 RepID=UPI001FF340AE|nr:hypothetical protein [Anaerobiospirillum sp. NML120449]MCK0527523.1 hypothetical protein [Anaerobiospirillum sp. NML120449]